MFPADIRVRILHLRELANFFMLAAAAEDNLDSNIWNLAEQVRELERRLASLVGNIERLESAFDDVMKSSGMQLVFQDGSLASPN